MRPIVVMVHPRFSETSSNRYLQLLYGSLEAFDVETVAYSSGRLRRGDVDVLHIHWPDGYAGRRSNRGVLRSAARVLGDVMAIRRRGTKVVWTVHNLAPHEGGRRDNVAYAFVARLAHGSLHLSEAGRSLAFARYPKLATRPFSVTEHGIYPPSFPKLTKAEARRSLGIDQSVRLVVLPGLVRSYKRPLELAHQVSTSDRDGLVLLIAGKCDDPALLQALTLTAEQTERIIFREGLLEPEVWETCILASDCVAVPYAAVMNSGVVLAALSLCRPVAVTSSPTIKEMAQNVGPGWITAVEHVPTPDELLETMAVESRQSASPNLNAYQWESIAERTRALYDRVLNDRRNNRVSG